MSDDTDVDVTTGSTDTDSGSGEETKTYTTSEIEKIIEKRLMRERQKYADYDDLKKASKETEKQRRAAMTEHEQALESARSEGRQEALKGYAGKLVTAEIRAALTGLVDDPNFIIEDLDLSKYVTEDGDVDSTKVEALKKKYEGLLGNQKQKAQGSSASRAGAGRTGVQSPATPKEAFRDLFSQLNS